MTEIQNNSLHVMGYQDLLQMLPDASVDMVLTDPPYAATNLLWDKSFDLAIYWQEVKRILKPNGVVVMTAIQPFTTDLIISNRSWFRYSLVWVKNAAVGYLNANRQPLRTH